MRQFLAKLILFFAVLAAALAWVRANHFRRHPTNNNYYFAGEDKERMLATNPPPRLVVVGGSSVAFGIDAELIAGRVGLRPINMGVQMGFGLSFMLGQVEPYLREGDVVVLALEYHAYTSYQHGDPELLTTLCEAKPTRLADLSFAEAKMVLDRGLLMRQGSILRSELLGTTAGLGPNLADFVYWRSAFNQYGDLVSYLNVQPPAHQPGFLNIPDVDERPAVERLNSFYRLCQRRGVKVFWSHPPFSRPAYEGNLRMIQRLDAALAKDLLIPGLDTAADTAYPKGDFFDTDYHLNPRARTKRSEELAARLQGKLQAAGKK